MSDKLVIVSDKSVNVLLVRGQRGVWIDEGADNTGDSFRFHRQCKAIILVMSLILIMLLYL